MTVLRVQSYRLSFDGCDDLARLREMRAAIRVVRILNQMRCDLAAIRKINLDFSGAGGRKECGAEKSNPMSEIGKRDEQAPVFAEEYLKRLHP
jgi:hypothetical protein